MFKILCQLFKEPKITEETKFEVNIKSKKYVFCVRAQDKFTQGQWSHWTEYQ